MGEKEANDEGVLTRISKTVKLQSFWLGVVYWGRSDAS